MSRTEPSAENPLSKKVDKILSLELDQDSLNSLKNVSELVLDNNLTTRRNLRANIEKQSLQINDKFITAFQEAFRHLQTLSDQVNFIDKSCLNMMKKIEELKFQTSDFLKQTSEVNSELKKLDTSEKVLNQFLEQFQLEPNEISLITSNVDSSQIADDRFFEILNKIQNIHETAKKQLANNQHITGFEIMDSMSKYEEMANDKLYRWTIGILRAINMDTLEMHSQLFRSIAYIQKNDVLFKHCLDEYITVRRSTVSHIFIEALTRGRTSSNTHYPAIERYSHDILRYIGDMLSFLHQTVVFEKDMLSNLLRLCDKKKIEQQNIIKSTLSSISEGFTRPLKIRIENSLISNNKSLIKTNEKQNEKTKNYFLVKNVINFYQQIFSQILTEDAPLLYLIKEMLILSDKVFYNNLNFYCSSNTAQKQDQMVLIGFKDGLNAGDHLSEFTKLVSELLEIIKSSMSSNVNEQKLETHRVLSAMVDPFLQHVIIYSSRLSSIEMTIFSYNRNHALGEVIAKYKFTEDFSQNIQKQLNEYVDVLVNEQFQQIINNLSVAPFYNAIIQNDHQSTPLSTFSGCDHIAISSFLKLFEKFINDPKSFQIAQIAKINDEATRDKIWQNSLKMLCKAYEAIHASIVNPCNNYSDIVNLIAYTPEQVNGFFISKR